MPDIDGGKCYAKLKKINPSVKVVISSGFAKTARIMEVEQLGTLAFLKKPYFAGALNRTVKEAGQSQ